jgi:hypothetical protein
MASETLPVFATVKIIVRAALHETVEAADRFLQAVAIASASNPILSILAMTRRPCGNLPRPAFSGVKMHVHRNTLLGLK